MHARVAAVALLLAGCGTQAPPDDARTEIGNAVTVAPVTLRAADGLTVYGSYYRAARPRAMILLFHQAGSSMDEYATIAPRLARARYSALAIDQRSGGAMFGANRTAGQLRSDPGYAAAAKDLQAALDWAGMQGAPVVVWASSYSAALAFPLVAANSGRVTALLAFSPGEYLEDRQAVARAAAAIDVPVFVAVATPNEAAAARPIVAALYGPKTVYLPHQGVHGSSTLIAAKNPAGAAENWRAVMAFLRRTVG
jgi:alpha-beta hydrolase superfamily lysophospholipase